MCWASQISLMASFVQSLQRRPSQPSQEPDFTQVKGELETMSRTQQVNFMLSTTIAPRLTPSEDGGLTFRFEPRSLLGAMWLQAAQSATEVTFRQCASCGKPIAIARTTGARADAKFCSDACKSRSYRTRQAQAIKLAERGWTPGRIAKELHTTTATVRGWIK
jgi:RNA polymerase-binding transcription factor DksA